MNKKTLTVSLVAWNGAEHLVPCVESLQRQTFRDFELRILDNGSTDGTADIVAALDRKTHHISSVHFLPHNVGFARAHNLLFREAEGEFILCLNQDVILDPDYLEYVVHFLNMHPQAGSAAGILLRKRDVDGPVVDSAGLVMYKNRRVADLWAGEKKNEASLRSVPIEVFGVSAAACAYRKAALDDVAESIDEPSFAEALADKSEGKKFFDEDFFSYKEDVDLAWRLRHRGWRSWVLPVFGIHARSAQARGRSIVSTILGRTQKSSLANFHSQKNHWFVLLKNDFFSNFMVDAVRILWYELKKVIYILLFEWKTIPSFFVFWTQFGHMLKKRKEIRKRSVLSPSSLRQWLQ